MNRKKAVAFVYNMKNETLDADADLNETFNQTVAAPLYSEMLGTETAEADALMDKSMNEDAETRVKAAQFSKAIETGNADGEMDYMLNASGLKNFTPALSTDADRKLDDLLTKSTFKSVRSAEAIEADKSIDELVNNK